MLTDKTARRMRFEGYWKVIEQEFLLHYWRGYAQDTIEWYERTFDYNVPGGKFDCGMSVVDTVEIIKGIPLTDDGYLDAAVLGWGIEPVPLNLFLISDDMTDSSMMRRGPPRYLLNCLFMLGAMIYYLPKKHLREESYVGVLGLFGDNVPDGHGAACMSKLLLRNVCLFLLTPCLVLTVI
ncbi:hypothetical protein EDD18DRAFT_1078307 [Armillaria luteobubalina]|uniref:(2E,6E)-farnesyl diphosphate synthase n=1 Tax=Armillaria luteobubalina TaxID=153913 RepID=A0AA39Q0N2_9AGAR|nr:hypothetical protein EDD18DRAFT_1078307 [Armillaria luteobubalina]